MTDAAAGGTTGRHGLTHYREDGAAVMVDVSAKDVTVREATATGVLLTRADVVERIASGDLPKGEAVAVARVAGIMAAKRTHELVPLCHPLPLSGVDVDVVPSDDRVELRATVRTTSRTGVEMEALTAVSIACLTIYDMAKAIEKSMRIEGIRLLEKTGGKSGPYKAED